MSTHKTLWYRDEEKGWHKVRLHIIDANHAVEVDPKNWSLTKPEDVEDQPEPKIAKHSDAPAEVVAEKPAEQTEQTERHEMGFTGDMS